MKTAPQANTNTKLISAPQANENIKYEIENSSSGKTNTITKLKCTPQIQIQIQIPNTKYQIEMYSSGKSLLERNEELAARNRAVAEQCHQKLEVRVVICCALLVLCWCFVLFDCATKQLSVVVYDHKTAEFSGVKKSVDKRIDFGDASLRLIIGPIIVIIVK